MVRTLTLLLLGCLMEDVFGNQFRVSLPQTVEAVTGSCLTIPCSFEIESEYEKHLNKKCEAKWQSTTEVKENQRTNLKLTTTKDMMGDLTKKNCTSTFKNMNPKHSDQYYFRLDCGQPLQYTYTHSPLTIVVKGKFSFLFKYSICFLMQTIQTGQCIFLPDVPPSPTLSPSAQEVKEGTSVSLTCSAPASCLLHPPSLTWTPKLAHSQETLKENQDQTKVQISVLNFTASHLHHGKRITCTAVYWKHGGSNVSVNSSLTAEVKCRFLCFRCLLLLLNTTTTFYDENIYNFHICLKFFLDSPKDTRVSVSPSGPAPENRSLSLTCSSDARPPVQNYSWYRDDGGQETLIGHGRVLNITTWIHNRVYFCKAENELGAGRSNNTHINVHFPPWIRPFSNCTKAGNQINCSCETEGNPAPTLSWSLNGKTINQSDTIEINTDSPNSTYLRSSIILSLSQKRFFSALICSSLNSLGSTEHQFSLNDLKTPGESTAYIIIIQTNSMIKIQNIGGKKEFFTQAKDFF
ncbi:myelin-associated glycoprotein-like [Oryzias latipes]|uniref:myelin-associated glycoprotein-like n=1 Tax=Oryzias latipes TaxID=8090 RepID=UPI000CE1DEDE|nr:myelin-associated glycoprotein-like [Oryzias latipes]